MKKFYLWVSLVVALFLIIGTVALWQISRARTFQFFGQLVPRVNTAQKLVALTFDDGPTPDATDQILAILDQAQIHATFFVTGAELAQNMAAGKQLVAAGHELGNHSYSHTRMVLVTPAVVQDEIVRTDELIRMAGYQGEIYFRPPFGKKLFTLPYYLAKTGRKSIMWDVEPESYPEIAADADQIADYVVAKTQPGSIIILHVMYPNRRASLNAVPQIIERLQVQGYRFATVSELLAATE